MRVLVVNAGSTSLRLSVLEDDQLMTEQRLSAARAQIDAHEVAAVVSGFGTLDAVGHRIVHGGTRYRDRCGSTTPSCANSPSSRRSHPCTRPSLDPRLNAELDGDRDVSGPGCLVHTLVVGAREDLEIARQVRSVLGS